MQLLDQLVGECEQVWRDRDTKLPCGLEVHHQPEFAGLFDRQVAGLYTPNYFRSVDTGAPIAIQRIISISQEQARKAAIGPRIVFALDPHPGKRAVLIGPPSVTARPSPREEPVTWAVRPDRSNNAWDIANLQTLKRRTVKSGRW